MANNVIKRVWNQNGMVAIEDLQGSAFSAESGGHTFRISGVDSEDNLLPLSGSVAASFLRPDQATVAISGSVSGGVVSVTLPANCYDVPGRFGLVIFLTSNGQKTAIYSCVGNVARSSTSTVAPQTTADVVDLINRINAAVATIPASYTDLMAAAAPTYSASALYPVGSYAWYDGKLYKSISPITTAESWTAAHWTLANLGDDVRDLKSAINTASILASKQNGKRIDADGEIVDSANTSYLISIAPLNDEYEYHLTTSCNFGNGLYSIVDSTGTVLSKKMASSSGAFTSINDELLDIPDGGVFIRVGGYSGEEMILTARRKIDFSNVDTKIDTLSKYLLSGDFLTESEQKAINSSLQIVDAQNVDYRLVALKVTKGMKLRFTGSMNFGNGLYLIVDANGTPVESLLSENTGTTVSELDIVIPENGSIAYIAFLQSQTHSLYAYTPYDQIENVKQNYVQITSLFGEANLKAEGVAKRRIAQGEIQTAGNAKYHVLELHVSAYEIYHLSSSMDWGNGYYTILDSNGNVLETENSVAGGPISYIDKDLIMPVGANTLFVGYIDYSVFDIKQIGVITNIENTISDKFLPIKDDFKRPFSSFSFDSNLVNAEDLDSSDWRKQYPGLGYDIAFNEKDNLYYLYYAAYNGTITQIGYMTSPDLETWTQASGNPILSPTGVDGDPDKGGMTFPQLLRNGNEWILYYIGFSAQGFERGVHKICYATSNDLQNWTRHGAIIDTTMFHDDREINVLYRPNVKNYNGRYYMFINAGTGDASPDGNTESIYVFVSDNPVTGWTYLGKCVDSEILYATESYKIVSDPSVVKCSDSKYYYMFCWSREGIIGLYSREDEFPMNWHYDKAMNAGVSRPLAVPTKENMILITNTGSANRFSKYVADWN